MQLHCSGQDCPPVHPEDKPHFSNHGLGRMRKTVTPKRGCTAHPGDSGTYPLGGRGPRSSERGSHGHLQACVPSAWGSAPAAPRTNSGDWGSRQRPPPFPGSSPFAFHLRTLHWNKGRCSQCSRDLAAPRQPRGTQFPYPDA